MTTIAATDAGLARISSRPQASCVPSSCQPIQRYPRYHRSIVFPGRSWRNGNVSHAARNRGDASRDRRRPSRSQRAIRTVVLTALVIPSLGQSADGLELFDYGSAEFRAKKNSYRKAANPQIYCNRSCTPASGPLILFANSAHAPDGLARELTRQMERECCSAH